jgi:hypothetical protein
MSGVTSGAAPGDPRDLVLTNLRLQQGGCREMGSPFYAALLEHMIGDVELGGPVWAMLATHANATFEDAYALRILGGLHKIVLSGQSAGLAARYPSVGGDGDADAAWPLVRALINEPPPILAEALTRPPQTNEVGRSIPLLGGMLVIARETGLPLRLRELGSSAGLNLRLDRYWFEQDGAGWGDPASKVRFTEFWPGGRELFERGASIVDRRGCDQDPLDATTDAARLALLSYVWPGQDQRFQILQAALDAAHEMPVTIDRADAGEWLAWQVGELQPGVTTVVYHSVFWQYLAEATRSAIITLLRAAGSRATPDAPLAWLRLEPHPRTYVPAELRLSIWPARGGVVENRLLAKTGFHLGPVEWLDSPTP